MIYNLITKVYDQGFSIDKKDAIRLIISINNGYRTSDIRSLSYQIVF